MALHNLPPQPTSFIGRADEIAEIERLLTDPACRLLTLVGLGGVGKTRLAFRVAAEVLNNFPDGVYFVACQSIPAPEIIFSVLANVMNYQFHQGDNPKQQLIDYLHKKNMLLMIDNFEHLLEGAGLLVDVLSNAPQIKMLTTSREALNIREEWLYHVHGMSFPLGDEWNGEEYTAVQLFVERAQQVRTDFSLNIAKSNVARICQLVEGMPLAIELAATWLKALSCEEIADQIECNLEFLTTTLHDTPVRHRSMRIVFEHSLNRLSDGEQDVFLKLTVFRGGCTREAAEVVAGASLFTLTALVDKSLIHRTAAGRYEIHELLRQFGSERLESTGNGDATRNAHSIYFLEWLVKCEPDLKGRQQLVALDEIEADFENIRAAWRRAEKRNIVVAINGALESLYWFCVFRSRFKEGADLLWPKAENQAAMPGSQAEQTRSRCLVRSISLLAQGFVDYKTTRAQLDRSTRVAQQHHDELEMAFCMITIGETVLFARNYVEALAYYQQALVICRQLNEPFYMARILQRIGIIQMAHEGQLEEARESFRQGLALAREIGDQISLANCLYNLGSVAGSLGDFAEYEACYREALAIRREMRDVANIAVNIGGLALVAFMRGDYATAKARAKEALEIAVGINHVDGQGMALNVLGLVACVEEDYSESQRLLEEGLVLADTASYASQFRTALAEWGLAILACGLGNYSMAKEHVLPAFKYMSNWSNSFGSWPLPIFALIHIHEGQPVSGIEILSLFFHDPTIPPNWARQWPHLTRLKSLVKANLGEDAYVAAWERGKALNLENVVTELLEKFSVSQDSSQQTFIPISEQMQAANQGLIAPLTRREHEILIHIAQGRSNREIAEQLFIEVSTVKRHISNCYGKLAVSSRTQAIVTAQQLKLV